jgi:hypothetical protein
MTLSASNASGSIAATERSVVTSPECPRIAGMLVKSAVARMATPRPNIRRAQTATVTMATMSSRRLPMRARASVFS